MSAINNPDWKPVVLTKKKAKRSTPRASTAKRTTTDDTPNVRKGGVTLGSAIKTARANKNWKQSDLANSCGLRVNIIRDYETGKATYNANEVNKIARALGVKLPRPKKK